MDTIAAACQEATSTERIVSSENLNTLQIHDTTLRNGSL